MKLRNKGEKSKQKKTELKGKKFSCEEHPNGSRGAVRW